MAWDKLREDVRCPCGAPATHQIWETHLGVCGPHALAWLHSEEKRRCTQARDGTVGGADWKPSDATGDDLVRSAVSDFVGRIQEEERTKLDRALEVAERIPIVGFFAGLLRRRLQ